MKQYEVLAQYQRGTTPQSAGLASELNEALDTIRMAVQGGAVKVILQVSQNG